jgi:hypothetical protein
MKLQTIQNRIYEIRGQKIMFDFDLAKIYGTETRALKQSVKRNIGRFPKDFLFKLNKKEWRQVITNCDNLPESVKFSPALPYAFTEHGITMLATILKSKRAIQMNIAIVRAFIILKQFASDYKELAEQIKELKKTTGNHNVQLNQIYNALENLLNEKAMDQKNWQDRERIGFKK